MKTESDEVSEEKNVEVRVSSEPCKPTTSFCGRPAHFVRRKGAQIRSAVVPVRFTQSERDTIKSLAESRRLSLSDFIRTVVLGRKLLPPVAAAINRSVYQELARIGNNLNQLVRAANSGTVTGCDSILLLKVQGEVRNLGFQLLRGHA